VHGVDLSPPIVRDAIRELGPGVLHAAVSDVRALPYADEAFDLMGREEFDVVVTDLRMRGMNGLGLCARIVENRPDIPVIVMTAFGSLETAVDTIRAGACDFITKPFKIEELVIAIERALNAPAPGRSETAPANRCRDPALRRASVRASMRKVTTASRVWRSRRFRGAHHGEWYRKELVARALHRRSRRSAGHSGINWAAMPKTLLESELSGMFVEHSRMRNQRRKGCSSKRTADAFSGRGRGTTSDGPAQIASRARNANCPTGRWHRGDPLRRQPRHSDQQGSRNRCG
jgi:two-component system response regulator HydG